MSDTPVATQTPITSRGDAMAHAIALGHAPGRWRSLSYRTDGPCYAAECANDGCRGRMDEHDCNDRGEPAWTGALLDERCPTARIL